MMYMEIRTSPKANSNPVILVVAIISHPEESRFIETITRCVVEKKFCCRVKRTFNDLSGIIRIKLFVWLRSDWLSIKDILNDCLVNMP